MENTENIRNTKITNVINYFKKIPQIALFGITNNRVLAGIMLLLCVFILPGFVIISSRNLYSGYRSSMFQMITVLFTYAAAVIIPYVLYSYVQKRRECDFYNSMPVKRSQYFWGYFLSGFAIFFVSHTLLTLIYGFMFGADAFDYFDLILVFLVLYCTSIASIMFSGSFFSTAVTFILRNAAPAALVMMPIVISGGDFDGYYRLLAEKICIFIPVTSAVCIGDYPRYDYIMLFQLLIAFGELILAFFMHRRRRSESTTALAFPKIRYFYQYFVTLIAVFLVDAFLLYLSTHYDSFDRITEALNSQEVSMLVFFTVVVGFVVFVILNVILEKSGAAAFRKIRHFFAFLAGYAVLIVAIFLSPLGNLPRFIIPFTPNFVIINVAEYRPATDEEAEMVRIENEEWYAAEYSSIAEENLEEADTKKRDFDYIYRTVEEHEEIYVLDKDEYYAVTDKEKISELVQCAQRSGGKLNLTSNYHKKDSDDAHLKKGDNFYSAAISFVEYPGETHIEDHIIGSGNGDYSYISQQATNAEVRRISLAKTDVLMEFVDYHLEYLDQPLVYFL